MSHALPMRSTRNWEGAQLGQLIQTGQRDIAQHYAHCINWGKLAVRNWSLLRDGPGISQWMLGNCITCCICLLGFISVSRSFCCLNNNDHKILKLFSSQWMGFTYFDYPPHPTLVGGRLSKHLSGVQLLSGVKMQQDTKL